MKHLVLAGLAFAALSCAAQAQQQSAPRSARFTLSLPPVKLAPSEYIDSFTVDVRGGRIVSVNRFMDDWDSQITWDTPDHLVVAWQARHFVSGLPDTKPLADFLTVELDGPTGLHITAKLWTSSTDAAGGRERQLAIDEPEMILKPVSAPALSGSGVGNLIPNLIAAPPLSEPNPAVPANAAWAWRKTELGAVPNRANVAGQPFVDEHGWNYGFVVQRPTGRSLWLNGKFGPVFQDFVRAEITDAPLIWVYEFSPDGNRLAYPIRQGGKMRMVLDGEPGAAEDRVWPRAFSPDSRHFACVVQRDGKQNLLLDGVPGPDCDIVGVGGRICFSPDSRRIAYAARIGTNSYLVVDQEVRRDWPGAGRPVFSPDSQRVAYINAEKIVVVDGRAGPKPDFAVNTWFEPVFSTDSQHFAYSLGNGRAFVDWQPLPLPDKEAVVSYVGFSPDLKRVGWFVQRQNKKQVFLDGQFGPVFDSVWGLHFSSGGSRYAYRAKVETNWWMVVDGKPEAEIDLNPSSPVFSPDGKRLAYIAGRGPKWWMIVDGQKGAEYEGTREWAGGMVVARAEREVPAVTPPRFSPDSRHVAYGTRQDGQWIVLLDNNPVGGRYEVIVRGGPSFHEDGSLDFLGTRHGVLYRVVGKP